MTNPHQALQSLLQPPGLEATLFPATSRYHGLTIQKTVRPDGREVAYVSRRFVPLQEQFETLRERRIVQGDRIDNLAYEILGDPEQFWRLCDANNMLDPQQLTAEVGRLIRITLPEGIQGANGHA
jgi:hypothetical protein